MTQPPIHWTALIAQNRAARVAHGRMRDRGLPQSERNEATIAFGRALDQMFLSMEALSEEGVLGFLSASLARRAESHVMSRFFSEEEEQDHHAARAVWLAAERERMEKWRSDQLTQVVHDLTCSCGKKRLATVTISDSSQACDDGLRFITVHSVERHDGALQGEVQCGGAGLEPQDAVIDVVHIQLRVLVGHRDGRAQPESNEAESPAFAIDPGGV